MVWCSQSFECDIKRRMHKTSDAEYISGVQIDMAAVQQKAETVYQAPAMTITQFANRSSKKVNVSCSLGIIN